MPDFNEGIVHSFFNWWLDTQLIARDRYGKDVREYFNSSDKFHFRLRGVLSNVLRDGVIHVGDDIVKRADLALSQLTK